MLVLSRERNQSLIFSIPPSDKPRTIKLMVVDIRGDKVRLGGQADADVEIDREEIHAIKQEEQRKRGAR